MEAHRLTNTPAVVTESLTRRFGEKVAVNDLTLEIAHGEVFGLLGHNGAGKTTTIRLLAGLLSPSSGSARVLGLSPETDGSEIRSRTGVLTETPALDGRLTGRENLRYFADFFSLGDARARKRIDYLLDAFELTDSAHSRVHTYSRGMHQRLALARAMLHDPEILFLDEPTSGLDPIATRMVHLMINATRSDGRSVFLCTHNLEEAERLCDRVAVLEHGRIIALGSPRELTSRVTDQQVEIETGPGCAEQARLAAVAAAPHEPPSPGCVSQPCED
jgi:ABC-2 type transport system ATP-binding protein